MECELEILKIVSDTKHVKKPQEILQRKAWLNQVPRPIADSAILVKLQSSIAKLQEREVMHAAIGKLQDW